MLILESGLSLWNPLILIVALVIVWLLVLYFRSRGRNSFKSGTEQAKIFLSGEDVPEAAKRNLKSSNVYWGFLETMKGYYEVVVKQHTGVINDYIFWFILLVAVSTIILLAVGNGA